MNLIIVLYLKKIKKTLHIKFTGADAGGEAAGPLHPPP